MAQGPPHDHPGQYRVFNISTLRTVDKQVLYNQQEADGFKLVTVDSAGDAAFYRDEDGH